MIKRNQAWFWKIFRAMKEHYHLLAKDDRSYHIRADINSVNI